VNHPSFVKAIHRFFNPVRHGALRDLEAKRPPESPLRKPAPGDPASEFERRRDENLRPNNVTFTQVYVMLALSVAAVAVVALFVLVR
jgi:hypothetical protein